jgi:hypothetical protein
LSALKFRSLDGILARIIAVGQLKLQQNIARQSAPRRSSPIARLFSGWPPKLA